MGNKSHVEIEITFFGNPNGAILFNVYKEARLRNICGNVRWISASTIRIIIEGEDSKLNTYTNWCNSQFPAKENKVTINRSSRIMNYMDFTLSV